MDVAVHYLSKTTPGNYRAVRLTALCTGDDDIRDIDTLDEGIKMRVVGLEHCNVAWCLDKSGESNPSLIATPSIDDLLLMLSANPTAVLDSPNQLHGICTKYAMEQVSR